MDGGEVDGQIILGGGEYAIAIATGNPPCRVTVPAKDAPDLSGSGGPSASGPVILVILEPPRILGDGFAFRATVMVAPCTITYRYHSCERAATTFCLRARSV